jgi:prophage antirepressor-like protein
MNELFNFEGNNVEVIIGKNGEPLFEIYSTGMALGHVKYNSIGKAYPRKERIDKDIRNAEIKACVQAGHSYITEEQLYDFMLECKTEKCKPFRKWVTHEVLPEIRRTGGYIDKGATPQQLEQLQQKINRLLNYKIKGDTINDVCSATGLRRKDIKRYLFDSDWVVEYNGEITNYDYRYIFIVRHKDIHFTSKGLDKILKDLQPIKPVRPLINKELYRK